MYYNLLTYYKCNKYIYREKKFGTFYFEIYVQIHLRRVIYFEIVLTETNFEC